MASFRKLTSREIERAGELTWYILRAAPQREYHVQRIVSAMGVTAFVPSEWRWRKKHRFQKQPEKTNYPAYKSVVFIGAAASEGRPPIANVPWWKLERCHLVLGCYTNPVTRFPRAVNVEDIKQVMRAAKTPLFELHEQSEDPGIQYEPGDEVRITDGLMHGETMTISEVANGIAKFYREMFGKRMEINVPVDALELRGKAA